MTGFGRYSVYGLHIASEVPLAPFVRAERGSVGQPDVTVSLGLPGADRQAGDLELQPERGVRILVRDGCQVFVELHGSLAESRIAEYVSGMTLAVVLQQRGALVLHASAVDLGGAVVAFTGPSGAGKSTTASVFAARGYPVVTDDFLPLHVNGSHVRCLGGTGTLKLLRRPPGPGNDVATAMDGKWLVRPPGNEQAVHSAALAGIFALEDAEEFGVCRVSGQHAIATLLRDAYCLAAAGPRRRAVLLEQCAAVASRVTVQALRRPRDLSRAAELVALVVGNVGGAREGVSFRDVSVQDVPFRD